MLIVEGWTVLRRVRAGEELEMGAGTEAEVACAGGSDAVGVGRDLSQASLRL